MIKTKPYQPRPYQTRCLTALAEARKNGIQKGLVVMAGGLGKTATAIFDAEQYLDEYPNSRFLYLCDQETILIQNKQKFRAYFGEERSYGLYSGSSKTIHRVDFLFATLQSVRDHQEDFIADDYDYVIVDEAHHTSADTYESVIRFFCPQFLIGLTATPDREDGRNILDVYRQILFEMDIYQGWVEGWLTRAHYELMLDDVDEQQLKTYLGPEGASLKISMAQLNRSLFVPRRDEEIVASARERIASAGIKNPRIFAFCSNITYAESMAKHFGNGAAVVHSGQSRALNEAILSDFRTGKLDTVIAVDMLNEGVDIPEANVLIFLRATDTKRIFFQQLARGLRLSPGKDFALVLDYVTNVQRIATVLEMEETSRVRAQSSPAYPSSAKRPLPITVNIPATPRFRIQRVDIERIFANLRHHRQWAKEEVIAGLIEMDRNGLEISHSSIEQNPNLPYPDTIKLMFNGSINNALKEAHINQTVREYNRLGRNEMIAEGKRMVAQGIRISFRSIDHNKKLSSSPSVIKEFGSILTFATLCGQESATKEQVQNEMAWGYWEESAKVGHWLSLKEVEKNEHLPTASTFRRTLGMKKEERIKLIIEICGPIHTENVSKAQNEEREQERRQTTKLKLAHEFYDASLCKGRWLSKSDFTKKNGVSTLSTYRKYFNGGIKAIIDFVLLNFGVVDAKLKPVEKPRQLSQKQVTRRKTNETMIKEYWKESNNAGHWLSNAEVDKKYPKLSSSSSYRYRFGNLEAVRRLAVKFCGDLNSLNNN